MYLVFVAVTICQAFGGQTIFIIQEEFFLSLKLKTPQHLQKLVGGSKTREGAGHIKAKQNKSSNPHLSDKSKIVLDVS